MLDKRELLERVVLDYNNKITQCNNTNVSCHLVILVTPKIVVFRFE